METKLNSTTDQLRTEFHTSLESMQANIRSMFKQLMLNKNSPTKGMNIKNAGGTRSSDIEHKSIMVTGGNNNTFTLSTTKHIDLTNPNRF